MSHVLTQTLTKPVELADVPERLRRLVDRCLQRDPKLRHRDIGDARLLLEVPRPMGAARPSRSPWLLFAASALVAVAFGVLAMQPRAASAPAVVRFSSGRRTGPGF